MKIKFRVNFNPKTRRRRGKREGFHLGLLSTLTNWFWLQQTLTLSPTLISTFTLTPSPIPIRTSIDSDSVSDSNLEPRHCYSGRGRLTHTVTPRFTLPALHHIFFPEAQKCSLKISALQRERKLSIKKSSDLQIALKKKKPKPTGSGLKTVLDSGSGFSSSWQRCRVMWVKKVSRKESPVSELSNTSEVKLEVEVIWNLQHRGVLSF